MPYHCNILFILTILISNIQIAFASSTFQNNYQDDNLRNTLMSQLNYYKKPYKGFNQKVIHHFCKLPKDKAEIYLDEKRLFAATSPMDAYEYSLLIGFAPCLEKLPKQSIKYLLHASRKGVPEASYNIGLRLYSQQNITSAQYYFKKAAEKQHPRAIYNYVLLNSAKFKTINTDIINMLETAAALNSFQAQHDLSIAKLKLYIQEKKEISSEEIRSINNIFQKIIEQTNNISLKDHTKKNLAYLKKFSTKDLVKKQEPKKPIQITQEKPVSNLKINTDTDKVQSSSPSKKDMSKQNDTKIKSKKFATKYVARKTLERINYSMLVHQGLNIFDQHMEFGKN